MSKTKSTTGTKSKKDFPTCWEFSGCPKEERDNCPAYPHHGRDCWKIQGTLCEGGKFENRLRTIKIMHCRNNCGYYKRHLKKLNRY